MIKRIMLVDDHQLIRDGVKSNLSDDTSLQIIAEANTGTQALDILTRQEVDLVIIDINMATMNGIDCTREIVKRYPATKVLALTMVDESLYIQQMLKAGASGYLLKDSNKEELNKAVNNILAGGHYYSPVVTELVMSSYSRKKEKPNPLKGMILPLTKREIEVFKLILKEYSNAEIAKELFISLRTVDAHKRNLLGKTGAKNVAGLVLYAVKNQIFSEL